MCSCVDVEIYCELLEGWFESPDGTVVRGPRPLGKHLSMIYKKENSEAGRRGVQCFGIVIVESTCKKKHPRYLCTGN